MYTSIVPSLLNNKPGFFFSLGSRAGTGTGRARRARGDPSSISALDYTSLVWTKAEILSCGSPPPGLARLVSLPSWLRWKGLERLVESWGRRRSGHKHRVSGASRCCWLCPSGMDGHSQRRGRDLCTSGKQVGCSRVPFHRWWGP